MCAISHDQSLAFCDDLHYVYLTFITYTLFKKPKNTIAKMPFHGQDAWRRHPLFNNLHRDPLPGFRAAVVVFGVYLVGEYLYKSTKYAMTPKVKSH
jgi:hypothetical protein